MLWHFIPAYNAHAARETTGTGANPIESRRVTISSGEIAKVPIE
jgi:hypothetical protein